MDKQELLDLKEEIDDAKNKVNRLEGRKEHLMQQLKEEWDCESIEEARQVLKELKEDIKDKQEQINETTDELKEKYDVE